MAIPKLQPLIKTVQMGRSRFLYGLDRTADDRLSWHPGGEALTPLQLAGKTAGFVSFMASFIQERAMPDRESARRPPPQSREEAKAALGSAFERLLSVLDGIAEADLQAPMPTPWAGEISLEAMLWSVPGVIAYHQGQLNYVQLAYGDKDPNVPPVGGAEEA